MKNEKDLKKVLIKHLDYLTNAEYALYTISSIGYFDSQYISFSKYLLFNNMMRSMADSLWKNLFCIFDHTTRSKDSNASLDDILEYLDTDFNSNNKIKKLYFGPKGKDKEYTFPNFLKDFKKWYNAKLTKKYIERVKVIRNKHFHPVESFILNAMKKHVTIKLETNKLETNKSKTIYLNMNDQKIQTLILNVKSLYYSLAHYFKINTQKYEQKINSLNELDNILSILEKENAKTENFCKVKKV